MSGDFRLELECARFCYRYLSMGWWYREDFSQKLELHKYRQNE